MGTAPVRVTHGAGGDALADSGTGPESVHQPEMLGWWSECYAAGNQSGQRSGKKESTSARTEQNPSGGGKSTWSSSCNGMHWRNVKELELLPYTKDLRKMMSYLALNSVLRNGTMFNVLECFLKSAGASLTALRLGTYISRQDYPKWMSCTGVL